MICTRGCQPASSPSVTAPRRPRQPALPALLALVACCGCAGAFAQATPAPPPPPPPAHTEPNSAQRPAYNPPAPAPRPVNTSPAPANSGGERNGERNNPARPVEPQRPDPQRSELQRGQPQRIEPLAVPPAAGNPAPAAGGAIVAAPRTYSPDPNHLGRPNEPAKAAPAPVTNYTPLPRSNPAEVAAPVARPVPSTSNGYYNRPATTPVSPAASSAPRMQTRPVYNINGSAVAGTAPDGSSHLNAGGSREVLSDVNTSRVRLAGINNRPIPQGNVTVQPSGHLVVAVGGGREYNLRPTGTIATYHSPNGDAAFRPDGRVESFRTANTTVINGGRGEHVISTRRPDNSIVVSVGRNTGYVQRPVVSGGITYQQRTWAYGGGDNGRFPRTSLYISYRYGGTSYFHYVPRHTYVPAFYGWAYYGWGRQYCYNWGWSSDPWYRYYGGYYAPTNCYPSAAAWLADYYLSQTLAYGYQQYDPSQGDPGDAGGYNNGPPPPPDGYQQGGEDLAAQTDTPISPAIKDLLAQDVQQQIAAENAAASQPGAYNLTDLSQVLRPNHLFVVSQPLNVLTPEQLACSLSAGNVLQLQGAPNEGAPAAALAVISSRRGDCPAGVQVTVSLADLEEMQNNLRAQLDSGLNTLYTQQGQNGLPPAPESAIAPPPRPAPDLPPDSENVQALIAQQQQQAAQAEQQVTQQAFPPPQL